MYVITLDTMYVYQLYQTIYIYNFNIYLLELITSLLSLGRGVCFVVEPSQCSLPPLQPVEVTITSYSDMWGDYNDSLICQVSRE